jgi:biotin transport system permease protein
MARDLSPFSYKNRASPLHRLPAGIKLIFLLAVSSAVFAAGFAALLPGALLILILASVAKVSIRELFSGSRMLLLSGLLVLGFRALRFAPPYFSPEGFREGLVFALSLLFCFAASSLFFSVSTRGQILYSLSRAELFIRSLFRRLSRPLRRKGAGANNSPGAEARSMYPFLSLAISLMLGFIPRFFSLWDEMEKAYAARGGRPGIKKLRLLIPPTAEAMLEAASETEKALEARGF